MHRSLKLVVIFIALSSIFLFTGFTANKDLSNKKVMHIDSYHSDYPGSLDKSVPISKIMKEHNITLKTFHMDTKNNTDINFKKNIALKAKKLIESFKPDVVIATDDNAANYLIVPHFIDSEIPFVFAGINYDASKYGFPNEHITGMIETSSANELFDLVKKEFAPKGSVALLTSDTLYKRNDIKRTKKALGIKFSSEEYVSTFKDWKKKYIELQDKADIIYVDNIYEIKNFNKEEAIDFIYKNTKIISCSTLNFMSDYVAISYARDASEQGDYAARTAIMILKGTSPADIPVVRNKKGKIFLNSKIINKLKIKIPTELLEVAEIID